MNPSHSDSPQHAAREGRITARPHAPSETGPRGLHPLNLDRRRDSWIYVPQGYDPTRPVPLIVTLHGAGGEGRNHLGHLVPQADEFGVILLAPTSRDGTWDVVRSGYGPDIETIDRALELAFTCYAIDADFLAVEGFSDGASCALSIGLTNGDLFKGIPAFSPGFMAPGTQRGRPRIFISHGTDDRVLGIDVCSRRIVPGLERVGYDVRYDEFEGGHTVPERIAQDAVSWFLNPVPATTRR